MEDYNRLIFVFLCAKAKIRWQSHFLLVKGIKDIIVLFKLTISDICALIFADLFTHNFNIDKMLQGALI